MGRAVNNGSESFRMSTTLPRFELQAFAAGLVTESPEESSDYCNNLCLYRSPYF